MTSTLYMWRIPADPEAVSILRMNLLMLALLTFCIAAAPWQFRNRGKYFSF